MSNTSDSGIRCYNKRVPLKYYHKSKTDQKQTIYNEVNKLLPRIMMDKKYDQKNRSITPTYRSEVKRLQSRTVVSRAHENENTIF